MADGIDGRDEARGAHGSAHGGGFAAGGDGAALSACPCCGTVLERAHLRQMTLRYRDATPVRVTLTLCCPRCGQTSWRSVSAAAWREPVRTRLGTLARKAERSAAPETAPQAPDAPGPITLEELLDFSERVDSLSNGDWHALREGLAS